MHWFQTIRRISNKNIPILCYHSIGTGRDPKELNNFTISANTFRNNINVMLANGLKPGNIFSPSDLDVSTLHIHKNVLITIDDGFDDTYHTAFQILTNLGLTATIFIVAGDVGHTRFKNIHFGRPLTWSQIIEMNNSDITIGSHTWSHPVLTKLTDTEILNELIKSKKTIENHIGSQVKCFAYPYGIYNIRVANLVKKAGYEMAYGLELAHGGPFGIKRINMIGPIGKIEINFMRLGYHDAYYSMKSAFEKSLKLIQLQKKEVEMV
jgi:peptidoglycan/xylan/chitin deacetylase (PgdA/CDA1 family)